MIPKLSLRLPAAALTIAALAWLVPVANAGAFSDCAVIDSDRERLACYDRLSGRSATKAEAKRVSLLEDAWGFSPSAPRYLLRYHQMNYFLPITYTSDRNIEPYQPFADLEIQGGEVNLDDAEAKFQLSFRYRLWARDDRRLGVWLGYTQLSTWQIYNGDESRPFRDTNYQPEIFLSYNPGIELGPLRWSLINAGFVHESNGRAQIISRSWDRLYIEAGLDSGSFALLARLWYRLPEDDDKDDNPDITDYYGHGSLTAFYRWGESSITLMGRGNIREGKGAAQLSYVTRPLIGPLRGYLQLFSGYGETMIDYNWNQTVVGAGVTINSIL